MSHMLELEGETQVAEPRLHSGGSGQLRVIIDGKDVAVRLRQCFPWSDPHRYLSLRDDKDEEVVLVEDPTGLAPESRIALEQALSDAGFVFEIVRVLAIDEEVEIRQWKVETKQGTRSFQTHLDDWPRTLPQGALLIRDVAGDLYVLADPRTMDSRSRELLWAFVD